MRTTTDGPALLAAALAVDPVQPLRLDGLTVHRGDGAPAAPQAVQLAAGRFVAPTGASVAFGLPNAIHRDRCQGLRPDLEAALTAHFGRPVPVELVVDETDNPSGSEQRPESGQPADDDVIDLEELVDAPDVDTGIDALTKAFPGAVLIEQPDA